MKIITIARRIWQQDWLECCMQTMSIRISHCWMQLERRLVVAVHDAFVTLLCLSSLQVRKKRKNHSPKALSDSNLHYQFISVEFGTTNSRCLWCRCRTLANKGQEAFRVCSHNRVWRWQMWWLRVTFHRGIVLFFRVFVLLIVLIVRLASWRCDCFVRRHCMLVGLDSSLSRTNSLRVRSICTKRLPKPMRNFNRSRWSLQRCRTPPSSQPRTTTLSSRNLLK